MSQTLSSETERLHRPSQQEQGGVFHLRQACALGRTFANQPLSFLSSVGCSAADADGGDADGGTCPGAAESSHLPSPRGHCLSPACTSEASQVSRDSCSVSPGAPRVTAGSAALLLRAPCVSELGIAEDFRKGLMLRAMMCSLWQLGVLTCTVLP